MAWGLTIEWSMMKRFYTLLLLIIFVCGSVNAQYVVGTSQPERDTWGNIKTTHRDSRGNITGISTTEIDAWGKPKTTHKSDDPTTSIWFWEYDIMF